MVRLDEITIHAHKDYNYDSDSPALGILAKATVSYPIGDENRRIETLTSSGLWGIDGDSGREYLHEIVLDELANLSVHLAQFNVDCGDFNRLAKLAVEEFKWA